MPSAPTPISTKLCEKCGGETRTNGFCVKCHYQEISYPDGVKPPPKWRHKLTQINYEAKTAVCSSCGPVKITPRSKNHKLWRCTRTAYERSRLYKQAYRKSKGHLLGKNCEICGSTCRLCYDHNHITNKFRGTLCSNCNVAMGLMQDSPERLITASLYLKNKNQD